MTDEVRSPALGQGGSEGGAKRELYVEMVKTSNNQGGRG